MLHPPTASLNASLSTDGIARVPFPCSPGPLLLVLVLEPASCAQSPRPHPVPVLAGSTQMPDPRCHNTNPESSLGYDSEVAESDPTRTPKSYHLQRSNGFQVISRRNLGKHLAHFARRTLSVFGQISPSGRVPLLGSCGDTTISAMQAAPACLPPLALSALDQFEVSQRPRFVGRHLSDSLRQHNRNFPVTASSCPIPSSPSILRSTWAMPNFNSFLPSSVSQTK